jgi:hypothetical protein
MPFRQPLRSGFALRISEMRLFAIIALPPPKTRTPWASSAQPVSANGPLMRKSRTVISVAPLTLTRLPAVRLSGVVIVVESCPAPSSTISSLPSPKVTCSAYVPAQTAMRVSGTAASTAACMLVYPAFGHRTLLSSTTSLLAYRRRGLQGEYGGGYRRYHQ